MLRSRNEISIVRTIVPSASYAYFIEQLLFEGDFRIIQ